MAVDGAPVTIAIVGTGTGDGGGVAPTPNGTVVTTPEGQPNLVITVVGPTIAILVRAVNAFLTTWLGLLTAAGIGVGGGVSTDLATVIHTTAIASLVVAGMTTIKNIVTVFGRLEGKYPLWTGSI